MFRHYLKLAVGTLASHKLYSVINILGLSVALTCVVFVILFVRRELSYDEWIPGSQDLYAVEVTMRMPDAPPVNIGAVPYPMGGAMRSQIPGVTGVTRLLQKTLTLTRGDRQFLAKSVDFVNGNFFSIIRLPFVEGEPDSALSQPESVVLSEAAARSYFGDADPMGRTLITNIGSCRKHGATCQGQTVSLRVTGVVRDLPQNSQLSGTVFIPMGSLADPMSAQERQNWFADNLFTYVTLAPGVKPATVLAAMPPVLDRDAAGLLQQAGIQWRGSRLYRIHLTPFTRVHLSASRWIANMTPPGSWNTLYGVIVIGILVLLVACFNFTNLATARAALRKREIGLRKTLGATRGQLTVQFLTEAVFLAFVSLLCAVAAADVLLPVFNSFLHQSLALNYGKDWRLDLMLVGVATAAGLISGIYPAVFLSRLRPVSTLQTKSGHSRTSIGLRDALVLMQFAISIGLGIATMVVFRQVDFARNLNLGFDRKDILVIANSTLMGTRQEAFAAALRANPGIQSVALSEYLPFGSGLNQGTVQVPGHPSQLTLNWMSSGPDYPHTYGIRLVAGRFLSASRGTDRFTGTDAKSIPNLLVNAAGARALGFTPRNAVGQTILFGGTHAHIVGVLANAKVDGAREPVAPTVYIFDPNRPMDISVRLRPGDMSQTLSFIDRTWHAFEPTVAIQRSFLDASFERLYRSDERNGTVFGVFVLVAIFIACLGLYGLVVFTAERRTKEVALRKISGARTLEILKSMLWRISLPVMLANAIAWPVTYYYLQDWLQGFANHISLNPGYFLTAGTVALLIAWATVFVHTLRLAHTSPIHALRYE
jgi:putative ABC transport system permease protein